MKELSGTARNYYLSESDKGFVPMVELVIITSEPQWHFGAGDLVRERVPETFRLAMVRGSVKELMRNLMEVDEELALLEKKAAAANHKGTANTAPNKPQPQSPEQLNNGLAGPSGDPGKE